MIQDHISPTLVAVQPEHVCLLLENYSGFKVLGKPVLVDNIPAGPGNA